MAASLVPHGDIQTGCVASPEPAFFKGFQVPFSLSKRDGSESKSQWSIWLIAISSPTERNFFFAMLLIYIL